MKDIQIVVTPNGLSIRVIHPETGDTWSAQLTKDTAHRPDSLRPQAVTTPAKIEGE